MLTKEDLESGYMSGRGRAYDPLRSAGRKQRMPYVRLNGLNDSRFDSVELLAAQDSGHNVEVDSLPQREDIVTRGMGALPSWVPTDWKTIALTVGAVFGAFQIAKVLKRRRKKG